MFETIWKDEYQIHMSGCCGSHLYFMRMIKDTD